MWHFRFVVDRIQPAQTLRSGKFIAIVQRQVLRHIKRRCFAERSIRVFWRPIWIVVEEMDGRSNEVYVFADVFRNRIGLAAYHK